MDTMLERTRKIKVVLNALRMMFSFVFWQGQVWRLRGTNQRKSKAHSALFNESTKENESKY